MGYDCIFYYLGVSSLVIEVLPPYFGVSSLVSFFVIVVPYLCAIVAMSSLGSASFPYLSGSGSLLVDLV